MVNVVRGKMTLVGPRPEIPELVVACTPAHRAVLAVRPGITGPGQVEYATRWEPLLDAADDPNAAYLSEVMGPKLDVELAYLRGRSLVADLRILGGTVASLAAGAVARRRGPPRTSQARPGPSAVPVGTGTPHVGGKVGISVKIGDSKIGADGA